jgi:hypothetical protein
VGYGDCVLPTPDTKLELPFISALCTGLLRAGSRQCASHTGCHGAGLKQPCLYTTYFRWHVR